MTDQGTDPDPDLSDRPKPDPSRSFLGMRPAFAGVATPLLIVALAACALELSNRPPASTWLGAVPSRALLVLNPAPGILAPRLTSIDPRMIVPARPEIDEAMIHEGRTEIDPRMIVPALPSPRPR